MAEEVVVTRPRRQQRDGRVGPADALRQRILHLLEERREAHRLAGAEHVAGDMRQHGAVGERIADAGRRLDVGVDDAPVAVRAARDVGREELDAAGRAALMFWQARR